MDELIINANTRKQLKSALSQTSHAYLFLGPKGLGKTTVAKAFATKLVGSNASLGDIKKWILFVAPEKDKKISIKQVRSLSNFVALKKPQNISKKIVIIDQADKMGIESANALLLTLEEPASDTVLILVSDNPADIPITLLSRLQKIIFKIPPLADMTDFADKIGIETEVIDSVGEFPALLASLDESVLVKHKRALEASEEFLASNLVGRLRLATSITEKDDVSALIDTLSRQISGNGDGSAQWLRKANALILARIHLYNNGSPKFVLEKLALDFE